MTLYELYPTTTGQYYRRQICPSRSSYVVPIGTMRGEKEGIQVAGSCMLARTHAKAPMQPLTREIISGMRESRVFPHGRRIIKLKEKREKTRRPFCSAEISLDQFRGCHMEKLPEKSNGFSFFLSSPAKCSWISSKQGRHPTQASRCLLSFFPHVSNKT